MTEYESLDLDDQTEEQVFLRANEMLLAGKSFCLFVVDSKGEMVCIRDLRNLNPLELRGFNDTLLEYTSSLLAETFTEEDDEECECE